MRANRRLFRLLTTSTASAATANAAARAGATTSVLSAISGSSSSEADVTHFKSERGVGLFVELACSRDGGLEPGDGGLEDDQISL